MQKNTAEIIDFEDAVQAKVSGSGGGFDHFTGMTLGTVFACIGNGSSDSYCDEFQLVSRQGITVLLGNKMKEDRLERHIGQKFWKLNTLVQILHVPDASKAGSKPPKSGDKDNNNGNSVEN